MVPELAVLLSLVAADPSPEQLRLLRTFREEFVALTPGQGTGSVKFPERFLQGSATGPATERPVREVRISAAFAIAKYEVPQNLWTAVMGSNPSRWMGPRNSVEKMTFAEAQEFCRRATSMMRTAKLITDQEEIRLPSESEWEYAARAGTTTAYSFGDARNELGKYAWSTENAAGNDPPVGAKAPNPWGLYDVHGYLWEWCADPWHADYQGAPTDGSVWNQEGVAGQRVARGGSWKDPGERLTSSYRRPFAEEARDDALGLRCVLAPQR